jgi:hypothetical protein
MRIEGCAVHFPIVDKHPNRTPFLGVLGYVEEPSDKAPTGARGHRILLSRNAAVAAFPSLLGMGLCVASDLAGHNAQKKIGIFTGVYLLGRRIVVRGFLYEKDCASDIRVLRSHAGSLGMSYELDTARIVDMSRENWTVYKMTFSGGAVLRAEKAAYKGTRFWLGKRTAHD